MTKISKENLNNKHVSFSKEKLIKAGYKKGEFRP
ncbi:unnamed protein product, partial [marine sediment metagenome]